MAEEKAKHRLADTLKNSNFKVLQSGYKIAGGVSKESSNADILTFPFAKTPYGKEFNSGDFELTASVGQAMFKEFIVANPDKAEKYGEKVGLTVNRSALKESLSGQKEIKGDLVSYKESGLDTSNTDSLYVKFLHETVYGDIGLEIDKYLNLVNVNEDLMKKTGFGSIKIPKIYPGIASALGEDGEIIYFGDNTDDLEITASVKAIGTKLTWQIMKRGLDGVVKLMMRFSANSLVRKIATDVVNTLAAGATNSNSGGLTYDNVVDSRADVNSAKYNSVPYSFQADKLVVDVAQFASLQKSTDYKNHVFRATILPGEKYATVGRMVQYFGDLEIVEVNVLDTAVAYGMVLDSRFAGIFVKESDYLTFERDLPNTFGSKEIVLGMSYGVGVLFGAAISKITS